MHSNAILALAEAGTSSSSLPPTSAKARRKKYLAFFSYAKADATVEVALLWDKAKACFPQASIFRDAEQHFEISPSQPSLTILPDGQPSKPVSKPTPQDPGKPASLLLKRNLCLL